MGGYDPLKIYKRAAKLIVWFLVAFLAASAAGFLLARTGVFVLELLAFVLIVGTLLGFVGTCAFWLRAFWRDELKYRPTAYQVRRPPPGAPDARRASWRVMVTRAVEVIGWPGLTFSLLAMLGLPLTIAGAVWNLRGLLFVGLLLLGAEFVDLAVVWPIRRVRRPSG